MAKKFEFFYKTLWKKQNEPYGQLNREEAREAQRERDEVREVERGRKGEESTAAGKVEGREETQLSPDCSPPAVKRLTPFNEGGGGGRGEQRPMCVPDLHAAQGQGHSQGHGPG